MNTFNSNQTNYVQNALLDWAFVVELELKKKLVEKNIEVTGNLLNSLSYQVFEASGGNSGSYQLSFLEYGRFVDMGAGRRSKFESIEGNTKRLKTRKPEKWYASVVYPLIYGGLLRRIQNNYKAGVEYTIKQLENGSNQN